MSGPHKDMVAWNEYCERQAEALHAHILALPEDQFKGQPWALIHEIETFARTKGLPMIFGGEKMQLAQDVLAAMDPTPKVLIEFGTFVGTSALGWGAKLRELNSGSSSKSGSGSGSGDQAAARVYCFELDPVKVKISRDMVLRAGLEDTVQVLEGAGSETLKKLVAEGTIQERGVDAAFIDHWGDMYLPDLKLCEDLKIFRVGSEIMADNTDFPGPNEYRDYVKAGGSGVAGAVKYESRSLETKSLGREGRPQILEVSTVVQV